MGCQIEAVRDVVIGEFIILMNGQHGTLDGAAQIEMVLRLDGCSENVLQNVREKDFTRAIQNKACCALLIVLDHQNDGSIEICVRQLWDRNKEF